MTGSPAPTRAHAAPATPAVRCLRRRVAAWALANGRPVDRDALAAVVGARTRCGDHAATPWTATDVGTLLWVGIGEWCAAVGADLPDPGRTARTLRTLLDYLGAHRLLPDGSDPLATLRRAVSDYGGGQAGARSRHPTAGERRLAPVVPLG
jgi:hypothetical protein